jgi:hypothetical protein
VFDLRDAFQERNPGVKRELPVVTIYKQLMVIFLLNYTLRNSLKTNQ